jgi:nicotinamidase-related amidase
MDIVFVEYYDFGPTVECLKEPIHNSKYEKVSTTIKGEWDGSLEVISEIDKLDHEISGVRFVGIYTDQCVHATVKGLQNRLPKTSIEVVAEACEAMDDEMHERGISSIKMLPNVKVV